MTVPWNLLAEGYLHSIWIKWTPLWAVLAQDGNAQRTQKGQKVHEEST